MYKTWTPEGRLQRIEQFFREKVESVRRSKGLNRRWIYDGLTGDGDISLSDYRNR